MLKSSGTDIRNLSRLSISGFILYSPVSIMAYPVSVLVVNPKSSVIVLALVGFLITIATFLPYFLLIKILKKLNVSRPISLISSFLIIIAFSGALRGIIFYYVNEYQGLSQPSSIFNRILASMFTTLFWLSASNVIINISMGFKLTYQSTLNQFLASGVGVITQNTKKGLGNPEISNFENDLSNSLSGLLGDSNPETFHKVSESLTLLINEELRPLSRRIWLRSLGEYPVINYKILVRDSMRLLNFSQVAFIGIMSVLALLNNLFLRDIGESLNRSLSYLVVTL